VFLGIGIILVVGLTGVGVWGLVHTPPVPTVTPVTAGGTLGSTSTPVLVDTSTGDPEAFARQVVSVLFDWDTHTATPVEIIERLLDWGDPTGVEINGLATDVASYLPDEDVWNRLRGYHTVQRFEVGTVEIPDQWREVTRQTEPGRIVPGTTAFTITGVRHRDGVIDGQVSQVGRPVALTVFVTCAPSFPECHVMRLSQLDNPLK
jgi:hypothetical protein